MTYEIQALLAERERLSGENASLHDQVEQLTGQLQMALARLAELEQRKPERPTFVKPNRLATTWRNAASGRWSSCARSAAVPAAAKARRHA
jgi:hypothetical protein